MITLYKKTLNVNNILIYISFLFKIIQTTSYLQKMTPHVLNGGSTYTFHIKSKSISKLVVSVFNREMGPS